MSPRRYLRVPKVPNPPDLPVAEAALLVFAEVGPAASGGTLLELAQLGVVRIDEGATEQSPQTVVLVNSELAGCDHHRVLLKALFPLLRPGESRVLRRGRKDNLRMLEAQSALTKGVVRRVAERGWFHRMPAAGRLGPMLRRTRLFGWGSLTPAGRAMVDEVLGFRRYFATLEVGEIRRADLIRFLPWALTLGLHHRWEQLAADLETDDDEPVIWWSALGMFRLGPFRLGLAAFANAATLRAAEDTKYAYGLYDFDAGDFDAFESGPSFGGGFDGGANDHNNW